MSWLSKWLRRGGRRRLAGEALRKALEYGLKHAVLEKLRRLTEMLDKGDLAGVRREIDRTIEYVEGER